MYIIQRETQRKITVEIVEISEKELISISEKGDFQFNWLEVTNYNIYAIRPIESKNVLGLMAIKDIPEEVRIEIKLLESSKENIGHDKLFNRIAGCLIAWACYIAFVKGYYGFVSLLPKTQLIAHYVEAYGFQQFGRQLASDPKNSHRLIKYYLENGK
jgi:hypothetical protein